VEPYLVGLLLAFYDAVPPELRGELTWHPSAELLALLPARSRTNPA
jgi:hypothetical protein